jgi:[ribosomal protein S18]-alanine N-acetyltransferase
MTPDVDIQPASLHDLRRTLELERACFGPDAWSALDLLFMFLGPSVCLRAVKDGQMVGIAAGETSASAGIGWITSLAVLPACQRQGIGSRLLAEMECRLAQPCYKLTVSEHNEPAIALYRQHGYTSVDRVERYYHHGVAGIIMQKDDPGGGKHP